RELSDQTDVRVSRPRFVLQIPLQFVPCVGPKTLDKLKKAFGTEMAVLHEATVEDLARIVPQKTAALIVKARSGTLELKAGGGGTYGTIK
ncbi:TIGR00375 family protein, partial [Bacillus vallismortis]|nr:TIGR00375 family protein [Bacillus vallismortis]